MGVMRLQANDGSLMQEHVNDVGDTMGLAQDGAHGDLVAAPCAVSKTRDANNPQASHGMRKGPRLRHLQGAGERMRRRRGGGEERGGGGFCAFPDAIVGFSRYVSPSTFTAFLASTIYREEKKVHSNLLHVKLGLLRLIMSHVEADASRDYLLPR